jgi:DNA-binding MarR family transcriptional regulator
VNRHIDRSLLNPGAPVRPASPEAGRATSPIQREILREHARKIRSARDLRQEWFDRNIFGEPAWEMLLTLYIIDGEERRLSTRRIAKLANLSLTTTLRWLDYLEEQQLISRRHNPFDQRVVDTELSEKGRTAMDAYLIRSCAADAMDKWRAANASR